MTIHELTPNALKYGALSLPGGELSVNWRPDGACLALRWIESNVPISQQPSKRRVWNRAFASPAPRQLGAEVDIAFEPDGLNAAIAIDLT